MGLKSSPPGRLLRMRRAFPFSPQYDYMDCGPACLKMIAKFHGREISLEHLREKCFVTNDGVSMYDLRVAAEGIGMKPLSIRTTIDKLESLPLPCIAHWDQNHFVVIHRVAKRSVHVADPAQGLLEYARADFIEHWSPALDGEGVLLLLEPSNRFHEQDDVPEQRRGLRFLIPYLLRYKSLLVQLLLGMIAGCILQLLFPITTQLLVDTGIKSRNLNFVVLMLLAQVALFASDTLIAFLRHRILLHVGSRVYLALNSDLLDKLLRLPLAFFNSRSIGEILQRASDHQRIQSFLTSTLLNSFFSIFTFILFAAILGFYSLSILGIFLGANVLSVAWLAIFFKQRRRLDQQRFVKASESQNRLIQILYGITEIRLNGAEQRKRMEWETLQAKLFDVNFRGLAVGQYQQAGMFFFSQAKNIAITFLAVIAVIDGRISLGMMFSIQYIVAQLNYPINQWIELAQSMQEIKMSLDRLHEIHGKEDEAAVAATVSPEKGAEKRGERGGGGVVVEGVTLRYGGPNSYPVLNNVNLEIPYGKTTAIVGPSGSGKTTLLKVLIGVERPEQGRVLIDGADLAAIPLKEWRARCGVVLQTGYLFDDTIAGNIALGDDVIDEDRLAVAAMHANIDGYIRRLPFGYNTRVGQEGHTLSVGQQQRLLIARAVYKNPEFIFFDEATSSLDANNERQVIENITSLFRGRTVVAIAHRLSTIKNADKIVVMLSGRVAEEGTHTELLARRGCYYDLVKHQLEHVSVEVEAA
jgi:ATP-binding cassette subfamily B protein